METQNDSSVVVAESGQAAETAAKEMTDMEDGFELSVGDYIEFTGGPHVGTKGMIYYLDEEQLLILPIGASDRLIEIDTSIFNDESTSFRRDKTSFDTFVEIVDLKEGNAIQTFDAQGNPMGIYKVDRVNVETDSVLLKQIDADGNEIGDELSLEFTEDGRVRGIGRDVGFAVMRSQEAPKPREEAETETETETETENENEVEITMDELEEEEEEEEAEEYIRQRKPEEVIYDDIEQKNDFIEAERIALDPAKRSNPKKLQRIRRLMENCFQLRNDILEYKETGSVEFKPVVFQTLANLLTSANFPLAKPVLRVYKSLYLDHSMSSFMENGAPDPNTIGDDTLDIQYLEDAVNGGVSFLEEEFKKGTGEVGGLRSQLPQLYTVLKTFYDSYFRVIGPLPSKNDSIESIKYDRDFFRLNPLELPNPPLKGLNKTEDAKIVGIDDIVRIPMSYMRAIKPRIGKYGDRKTKMLGVVEEGDEAEVWLFILFPFLFLRDLGVTRSGKLSMDMGNSFTDPKTMQMILDENGGIQMIPKAGNIIVVDPEGATSGNIELDDWLKGQTLYGNGLGDILPYLKSIGLGDAELTPGQQDVLLKKIEFYQANLKKFLIETRKEANEIIRNPKPVVNFSLLEEADQKQFLENLMRDEKIIIDAVGEFKLKYPSWKNNDLAIFAYLYTAFPDFVIASASGLPTVAEERRRVMADMFLKDLYIGLAYNKKLMEEGDPPVINECNHVKNLEDLRKIQDDDQRIRLMIRVFLPMFAGKTENHWIECKWCKGHLLCEHEYLMILEKTHPLQKDIIHKKILMTFSDGSFNGKYICGTCGQAIQSLEFDQSMEFDDNGRPMMGNEPISEEMETTLAKEIDKLLEIKAEDSGTKSNANGFSNQEGPMKLVNEIATKVGIYPSVETYTRLLNVIKRIHENRDFKDVKKYNDWVAGQKDAAKKQGKKEGVYPTYDQYLSQDLINTCAAAILLEVQTAIPEYTIRSVVSGCGDATFEGYPVMNDENQIGGLEYIACSIASLLRNEAPWSSTFWATMSTSKDGLTRRKESILRLLKAQVKKLMNDADIQSLVEKKRDFLRKEKGEQAVTGRYVDKIPSDFTPLPIILSQEQLKNAEAPTIGDAATPSQRAFAWLLEGYKLAKTKGLYQKGNPLSEASCCYSVVKSPMLFWQEQSMPVLDPKMPPKGPRGSMLLLKMEVRPPEALMAEPEPTLMYRLFLRVCFPREGIDNPRVGLQHEPGYDNKCPYCQFEFPVDPRLPPPQLYYSKDKKLQKAYEGEFETEVQTLYQEEIKALQDAGVIKGPLVEKKTFETLLQATNQHFIIPPLPVKSVATDRETLEGLASLNPEPFEGYKSILTQLIDSMKELSSISDEAEIRLAYGPLSSAMTTMNEQFKSNIIKGISDKEKINKIGKEWTLLWNSPPETLGEMLRTFFLIPLQKVVNSTEFQPVSIESDKRKAIYSTISRNDRTTLMNYMTVHGDQVAKIKNELVKFDEEERDGYIQKIKALIEKLVVIIPLFIKVLRANVVPFGQIGLPYIQRSILVGAFWEFIDPDAIGGKRVLCNVLNWCMLKAQDKNENTIKTPDEIRRIITSRNESEKVEIINELDKMTPEAKRAELAMKSLGLGRWARGAGIFTYDEEQQAFEAAERQRRGIEDFYGLTPEEQAKRSQETLDSGDGSGYDNYADDAEGE